LDAAHFIDLGKGGHVNNIGLDGMIAVFVSGDIVEPVKYLDNLRSRSHENELDPKLLAGVLPCNLPNSPGCILYDVGNIPVIAVTDDNEVEGLSV